jgi:hypothetical protein
MSGKLKANYQTGETQVLLPFEFHNLDKEARVVLLKNWIQGLIDELNSVSEEPKSEPQEDVAELEETPLPPTDKVAAPKVEAEAKPKRAAKKVGK